MNKGKKCLSEDQDFCSKIENEFFQLDIRELRYHAAGGGFLPEEGIFPDLRPLK